MKKLPILLIVLLAIIILSGYYVYQKIEIYKVVSNNCGKATEETWIDCAVNLALEKKDAKYCQVAGVFSLFTKTCLAEFSMKALTQNDCQTIWKPKYKNQCLSRFK